MGWVPGDGGIVKSTLGQIQDGVRHWHQNWPYSNRNNSAADCSSLLKFGTLWVRGGCGIVEFVSWYIMCLVIKDQNSCRRDVEQPQVAVHRNCHLFLIRPPDEDWSSCFTAVLFSF